MQYPVLYSYCTRYWTGTVQYSTRYEYCTVQLYILYSNGERELEL